jgi:phospholipid/cholesterol/gamma-HCH transport system substrate-binding protein
MTDGDVLETKSVGPDVDQLTAKVSKITEDVAAITTALRTYVEDESTKDALDATFENVRMLTEQIKELTMANRAQVDTIARNLSETSGTLNDVVNRTAASIKDQLVAIEEATRKLDSALASVESIAAKVDQGDGTLGRLVNDDETISQIDATITQLQEALGSATTAIDEISSVVADVTGLEMQVRYNAQLFLGSQPTRGDFPEGNPIHLGMRHILGIRIIPSEERYYLFEVVDHPLGVITYEDHSLPSLGSTYREYVRSSSFRVSFQVARRWNNTVVRFGLKESSGGVGVDQFFFEDKLLLSADLYDAQFASWPILDSTPNVSFSARLEPIEHLWLQAGFENVIFGARYGFVTGYIGAGFHFYDDDLKWVLAALPGF